LRRWPRSVASPDQSIAMQVGVPPFELTHRN
jgi:hypothetical protein